MCRKHDLVYRIYHRKSMLFPCVQYIELINSVFMVNSVLSEYLKILVAFKALHITLTHQ